MADSATFTGWTYASEFDSAPDVGEVHVIVVTADDKITGAAGTVLEKFAYLSKASDAQKSDGTNNYYKNVINSRSAWIWWMDHPTAGTNLGSAKGTTFTTLSSPTSDTLSGGTDIYTTTDGQIGRAHV